MTAPESSAPRILIADSVTKLGPEHRGSVLIAGSHGGIYAGYLAARAGAIAVILNDAGVGKDRAGIGSLAYLGDFGVPAAAIDHMSARIGDGEDMAGRGVVSHVNGAAEALGARPGQPARECAERLLKARAPAGDPPVYAESRFLLRDAADGPKVWGIDSVSLVRPEDAGQIVISASHGALLAGVATSAIRIEVLAACFNDAGVGADGAGVTRLPALDRRGIAGATVDCDSARIGDARSSWETGIISHANETATAMGVRPGLSTQAFADAVLRRR